MNKRIFIALSTLFLCTGVPLMAGERPGRLVKGTKRKVDPVSEQENFVRHLLTTYSDAFLVKAFLGKHPALERSLSEQYRVVFIESMWDAEHQHKVRALQELEVTHRFPWVIACEVGTFLTVQPNEADAATIRKYAIKKFNRLAREHKRLN